MVLCPIAVAASCSKCPIVRACPLKSVIGDYKAEPKATPPATPRATARRKR